MMWKFQSAAISGTDYPDYADLKSKQACLKEIKTRAKIAVPSSPASETMVNS